MTPPLTSSPLFAGFDLGTSNSAVAIFDGDKMQVVRNAAGATLTPSVVRMDGKGRVMVGQKAVRYIERDPNNTHREFKRLMGTTQTLTFAASGTKCLPEELSAQVLSALRKDVEDVTGILPVRAVISVPALFELPQSRATSQAANLAGFEQVELLQEPIASALAAGWNSDESGSWLVYDLGGGTFDVSLLETRDGLLKIIGHDGDNYLGGRDFDRSIVDWMLQEISRAHQVEITRNNPAHSAVLDVLRFAAEAAKIELSRAKETEILVEVQVENISLDLELTLTRKTLEQLCKPLITRSIGVCQRLLASHGLVENQLARIVLVGGPSVMPAVRSAIEESLHTKIATGLDPMTLVAQGAALFAATAGLNGRPSTAVQTNPEARKIWCQYPPVSADLEPFFLGKFADTDRALPTQIKLQRIAPDDDYCSETVPLDQDKAFVLQIDLIPRTQNRFKIVATDKEGHLIPTQPSEVEIIQGLTIGDPPLSRSIGIALADDSVHTYFERGTALPARRTFRHNTVETIASGNPASALTIPIVQGEFEQAHLCQLVGELQIRGAEATINIPAGSSVEMTLVVDRGGKLSATAHVELANQPAQTFEGVAQLIMPEPTPASLQKNLRAAQTRIAKENKRAFSQGRTKLIPRLSMLDLRLAEVEPLIDAVYGGDSDAGLKAARILLQVDAELSDIDAEESWPMLEQEAQESLSSAMYWCSQLGKENETRMLERASASLDRAIEHKSVVEVTRQLRIIRRIRITCYRRDPNSWTDDFRYCAARVQETSNLPKARNLVVAGERAIEKNDTDELRSVVKEFWQLMPSDPEAKRKSYDSGIR